MTEIVLAERGEPWVGRLAEDVGETLSQSGVVTATRLGGGMWAIGPASKVGAVSIGEVMIWVRPKVPIRRILFLLGYVKDPGWRDDTVRLASVPDLVPALAQAYVAQAERALDRGVLHGYVEVEDSLTVLRGRLRSSEQLQRRFGIALPLLVRFDDHVVDTPENQLLRSAAERLLRLPGVDARSRARLRGVRATLADVTPHVRGTPLPRWTPTRLNARYHVALWLAEIILRGNAVDLLPGDVRINGFLVDMWKVFEDFLTVALSRSLLPHGGSCRTQDRHHLDVAAQVTMKPDLVWYRRGVPLAVIDAKYKAESPSGFPEADLYQLLAYATVLGLTDGHLVYAKGNAEETTHTIRNASIAIHAHTLDLDLDPAALLGQVQDLADRIAGRVSEPAQL